MVKHVSKGGKEVLLSDKSIGDNGANVPLPINEEWHTSACLKETILSTSITPVHIMIAYEFLSLVVIPIVEHRTIVAGEDDNGVLEQTLIFEFLYNLTHAPVGFDDNIATRSHRGGTNEFAVRDAGNVRLVKPIIEEEGLSVRLLVDECANTVEQVLSHILVVPQSRMSAFHEADARNAVDDRIVVPMRRSNLCHEFRIGYSRRHSFEVLLVTDFDGVGGIKTYDIAVLDIDTRYAIDRCRKNAGVVETYLVRTRFDGMIPIDVPLPDAQMPLAHSHCAIACILEHAGDSELFFANDERSIARQDVGLATPRIDACEQAVSTGRRGGRRSMSVGEANATLRQTVDIGRLNGLTSIGADIAIAEVVGNDKQNVGTLLCTCC